MIIVPELLNPKSYFQKPYKQFNNQEESENDINNNNNTSVSINNHISKLNNNLINFQSFFQRLLKEEIVIQDNQIKENIKILYETIKEVNVYLSNLKLNQNNHNNNQNFINIENGENQFDLSYLIELLYQFLLINSNSNNNNNLSYNNKNNNRIEIFLWIFKIISLIISQDNDKIYIEILISMGLLNHLRKLNRQIIITIDTLNLNNNNNNNNNNNSTDSDSSDNNIHYNNQIELDIYLKIQFLINDIINQINNFNNNKYIFKKLYFNNFNHYPNYIEITIRQLFYNNVGLGYKVWESSLLLSEIILRNSELFKGKRALELGSGVGLGGIIASNYTKSIILTDFVDSINDNIKFNIDENFQDICNKSSSFVTSTTNSSNNGNYKILNLDWNNLDKCELKEDSFDIVFGSDLIYCQSAAKQIPIVLSNYLVIGGVSLLVLPICREGIKQFEYDINNDPNLKVLERYTIKNLGDDGELLVLLLQKTRSQN